MQQGLRNELLEMTKTIAQTHAEVTEIKPETVARGKFEEPAPNAATDVVAAAERLQDLAWTMREHGLDITTCEQIETLAFTILSASSLRDPGDRRAQKLGEALRCLERRIDCMIAERAKVSSGESPADAAGEPEPASFLLEPLPIPLQADASAPPEPIAASMPQPPIESAPTTTIVPTPHRPSGTTPWPPAQPMARPMPSDPLAALNAMSDDEKIALFT